MTLRATIAELRAVRDLAHVTVTLVGRPDDDRDHSMATLTRRDLCLFCDAVTDSVDALERIAAVVDGVPGFGVVAPGQVIAAFVEIRAILDGKGGR